MYFLAQSSENLRIPCLAHGKVVSMYVNARYHLVTSIICVVLTRYQAYMQAEFLKVHTKGLLGGEELFHSGTLTSRT